PRNERGIRTVRTAHGRYWLGHARDRGSARTIWTLKHQNFRLIVLLEGHLTPQDRTQHPACVGLSGPQANDGLVGPVKENGDGVAVADNRADQRQWRMLGFGRLDGGRENRLDAWPGHRARRGTPGGRENRALLR